MRGLAGSRPNPTVDLRLHAVEDGANRRARLPSLGEEPEVEVIPLFLSVR